MQFGAAERSSALFCPAPVWLLAPANNQNSAEFLNPSPGGTAGEKSPFFCLLLVWHHHTLVKGEPKTRNDTKYSIKSSLLSASSALCYTSTYCSCETSTLKLQSDRACRYMHTAESYLDLAFPLGWVHENVKHTHTPSHIFLFQRETPQHFRG